LLRAGSAPKIIKAGGADETESKETWHALKKDTTSYIRVKDSLASGASGRSRKALGGRT